MSIDTIHHAVCLHDTAQEERVTPLFLHYKGDNMTKCPHIYGVYFTKTEPVTSGFLFLPMTKEMYGYKEFNYQIFKYCPYCGEWLLLS